LKNGVAFDKDFTTPWEPGFAMDPTSARFAVVDFDSTNNTLTKPAVWNRQKAYFETPDKTVLD